MLLQGSFKLMEAKCNVAKAAFVIDEGKLHPSCDTLDGYPNEASRHRWLVQRRSFGGHYDRPKYNGLNSAKPVG